MERDISEYIKLYRRAIDEHGDVAPMCNFADLLDNGIGVAECDSAEVSNCTGVQLINTIIQSK